MALSVATSSITSLSMLTFAITTFRMTTSSKMALIITINLVSISIRTLDGEYSSHSVIMRDHDLMPPLTSVCTSVRVP
jgi:hypothetical protein